MGTISLIMPIIGQPDNTEDVKLINALTTVQNVINGALDTNNLSSVAGIKRTQLAGGVGDLVFKSKSANYTAVDGDFVISTAALTVTLPAPAISATVGVLNNNTGTVTTVRTPSGQFLGGGIYQAAVTSFSLAVLSSVVLMSDGTNWFIVAGQQDTGWVSLTSAPAGPYAVNTSGSETAAARLIGERVYLQGAASGAGSLAAGLQIGSVLPSSAFYPTVNKYVGAGIYVHTDGTLYTSIPLASGQVLPLTGASYVL